MRPVSRENPCHCPYDAAGRNPLQLTGPGWSGDWWRDRGYGRNRRKRQWPRRSDPDRSPRPPKPPTRTRGTGDAADP